MIYFEWRLILLFLFCRLAQIYIFMKADERFLSVPEWEKHIDFVTILLLGVFCYLCYFLKYSIL
jgi:hypothetical protein